MGNVIVYFAKRTMLVTILTLGVLLIGGYSYLNLRKEANPSTDLDMVIVQVVYPGASVDDVEKNAVIPIEKQLKKISGIKEYNSIIIENAAILTIKIDQSLPDKRPTKDEIFRKMQNVPDISQDVKEINTIDVNPKMLAIYTFGLHFKEGQAGDERDLYDVSKMLENSLRHLDSVAEIRVSGRTNPEVQVFVDPLKTQKYYISLNDIVSSINTRNVRSTGGNISLDNLEQTIVTWGEFENVDEVRGVIIRSTFDGSRVFVDDVAKINDGFVKKDVLMRVNKTPGYSLSIVKKENADILKTIETVNQWLKDNADLIPDNMVITPMQDNSRTIVSLLNVVSSNLITGFAIIFIVLIIFLDIKSALYTSLGMIIIIFGTLIYMKAVNIAFNMISLAAIITVLGMIVDNSIVVSESIFNFKQKGHDGLEATRLGVSDVVMPIIVSTMTTVTAFAPMLFITGIMGKFVGEFPKVVIAALLISFFQAIFLLPNQLMDRKKRIEATVKKQKKPTIFQKVLNFDRDILFDKMKIPFGFFLEKALKFRYVVILGFVALLFASFNIAQDSFKNFVLVYDTSEDIIVINMDAGNGVPIAETSKIIGQIEDIVLETVKKEELVAVYTLVGKQVDQEVISEEIGNLAGIMVYLVPSAERKRIARDIHKEINDKVDARKIRDTVAALNISVKGTLSGAGKAIDIKIIGNNTEHAKIIKTSIEDFLGTIDGVINLDDDDKVGKQEVRVLLDYKKIAELGIDVATIANEIRTAYNGTIATYIQGLENKLEFRVQYDRTQAKKEATLGNILVPNNAGRLVPLKSFSTIEIAPGKSTLRHFDSDRAITITGDIESGKTTSQLVKNAVSEKFAGVPKQYRGMEIKFGGEAEETTEAINGLLFSFLIAVVTIYIILLLQFNRFIQPLLILLIIPFGLIGVLLAFTVHKMPMSFMGFIGIIGLAGVVVNNGIIMVDLINKIIDDGVEGGMKGVFNAIVEGAKARLRPVFLTTATTILGLLPTVYGIGGRADIIVPIVMALAYGLLFASLLTLIFLPCIFMISFDLKLFKLPEQSVKKTA